MKIFKIFIKDCIKSYWFYVTAIFGVFSIADIYLKFLANFSNVATPILNGLIIICSFATSYKLYRKVALKYPMILIKDNKDLEFEDFSSFFEFNKLSKKPYSRYKINVVEDKGSFEVGDCFGTRVTLKFYNKIYIKNSTNKIIDLGKPIINLISINNVTDNFFMNRLKVSLSKCRFSNQRFMNHYDYIPLKEPVFFDFPYRINPKENLTIFMYMEIDLDSIDTNSFDELLEWIRNINLKLNIPFIKGGHSFFNTYGMKYTFKDNLIKDSISKRIKFNEEVNAELEIF